MKIRKFSTLFSALFIWVAVAQASDGAWGRGYANNKWEAASIALDYCIANTRSYDCVITSVWWQ